MKTNKIAGNAVVFFVFTFLLLFSGCVTAGAGNSASSETGMDKEMPEGVVRETPHAEALQAVYVETAVKTENRTTFLEVAEKILDAAESGATVAFIELINSSGKKSRLADEVFLQLEPVLVNSGSARGLQFIERRDLKLILDEWDLADALSEGGGDKGARNLLDAEFILTGRVTIENDFVRVSLKMTRLRNGEIVSIAEGWQRAEPVHHKWAAAAVQEMGKAQPAKPANEGVSDDGNLRLWTDAVSYRVGDTLTVSFEVKKPLYVKIIDATPDGEVTTIFPNPYQKDNFCKPGIIYRIPPVNAPFSLEVTPPAGTDRIKAIASAVPFSESATIRTRGIKFTQHIVNAAETRTGVRVRIE